MIKKLSLIFLFSILLFAITASFVFARDLEITYPAIGNIMAPETTRTFLPDYVKYIFNFVIAISGIITFGVIVFAGFQAITQAQNPAALADAKKRIFEGVSGLILILSSYIILNTIDPHLTIINPIVLSNQGVILYKDANCPGGQNPEAKRILKPESDWLKLGVSAGNLGGLKGVGSIYLYKPESELKVFLYPQVNFNGTSQEVKGAAGSCVPSPLTTAQSVELQWQNPGVYLCKDTEGKKCSVYNSSQPKLADGFEDQIKYIKFKNSYSYDSNMSKDDCDKIAGNYFTHDNQTPPQPLTIPLCGYFSTRYGAVLHEARDYGQNCKEYFSDNAKVATFFPFGTNDGVSSITVFMQNSNPAPGGVTMYENINYNENEPEGKPRRQKTLTGTVPSAEFKDFYKINYEDTTNDIANSISSFRIDKDYMILLFDKKDFGGRCEVFKDNAGDLRQYPIKQDEAESAKLIPIKK